MSLLHFKSLILFSVMYLAFPKRLHLKVLKSYVSSDITERRAPEGGTISREGDIENLLQSNLYNSIGSGPGH